MLICWYLQLCSLPAVLLSIGRLQGRYFQEWLNLQTRLIDWLAQMQAHFEELTFVSILDYYVSVFVLNSYTWVPCVQWIILPIWCLSVLFIDNITKQIIILSVHSDVHQHRDSEHILRLHSGRVSKLVVFAIILYTCSVCTPQGISKSPKYYVL